MGASSGAITRRVKCSVLGPSGIEAEPAVASSHVVRECVEVFGERLANLLGRESESLRLVDMVTPRAWLILRGPLAEGLAGRFVEVQTGVVAHPLRDPGGIGFEGSLSHIDEQMLAQDRSSQEGPTHAVAKVLEDLGTDGVRV